MPMTPFTRTPYTLAPMLPAHESSHLGQRSVGLWFEEPLRQICQLCMDPLTQDSPFRSHIGTHVAAVASSKVEANRQHRSG